MNRIFFASLLFVACSTAPASAPAPTETWTKDAAPDTSLVHFDASALTDSGISGQDFGADAAPSSTDAASDAAAALPDASPDASPDAAAAPLDAASDAAAADAAPSCNVPDARGSECGLDTNCGCTEGLVCRVADQHTGQTLCFAKGNNSNYSYCDFDQDCEATSVCENHLCYPLCNQPGTLCSDDSWCGQLDVTSPAVCLGHCSPLVQMEGVWTDYKLWIDLMRRQHDQGVNSLPIWSQDFKPCGTSGYCSPGTPGISPFPYCIASTASGTEGSFCFANQDCQSGFGCYESQCRILAFLSSSCPSEYTGVFFSEPTWITPDGFNNLGICK